MRDTRISTRDSRPRSTKANANAKPTARAKQAEIRDLPFRHTKSPGLGIEVFRLSELFARIDHELEVPKRPEFHILYVGIRGRGAIVCDFAEVPFGEGLLTVTARGRVHHFLPIKDADAWLVLLQPEAVAGTLALLDPTWMPPVLELGGGEWGEMLALCEQLAAEQARALDAIQPRLMEALASAILLRGERLVTAAIADRPTAPPALQRFFTILERDCLTTREVAHYAKKAGISPRQLAELLVAHTGKSTKRVVDDRSILEMKRLLAHTDISIKELAERAGFDEPTNLVKFFRARAGTTPEAFRKNLPSARRS